MEHVSDSFQLIFNVLVGLVGTLGGWILNSLKRDNELLTQKVQAIEVIVAGEYIKRDEFENYFNKLADRIDSKFDKLEHKLDSKADK